MENSPNLSPTLRPRAAHTHRSWGQKLFLPRQRFPQPAIKFIIWQKQHDIINSELFASATNTSIDTNGHDNGVCPFAMCKVGKFHEHVANGTSDARQCCSCCHDNRRRPLELFVTCPFLLTEKH